LQVALAALGAGVGRGVGVVNGDRNAPGVQHPGEDEATQTRADDRDRRRGTGNWDRLRDDGWLDLATPGRIEAW
jgi:hypothetical protein